MAVVTKYEAMIQGDGLYCIVRTVVAFSFVTGGTQVTNLIKCDIASYEEAKGIAEGLMSGNDEKAPL